MIVLGIDPGSRTTGYGVVSVDEGKIHHLDNGGIHTRHVTPLAGRLEQIHREALALIERFHPDVMAIEEVFVAHNVKSAMTLGHARGVVMLAAALHDVRVVEYSAREVKQALVGHGAASKHQIQHMTRCLLKLPDIAHEDAADALAVAICHCHAHRLEDVLRERSKT